MASFADFSSQFKEHLTDLAPLGTTASSAARLKKLLQAMILKQTDLQDNPARFYAAHRYISAYAHKIGPGFFIRFTVQFNLFAGTVLALGNDEQKASLNKMQADGELGCFGLTERLAGVSSGLVVQTECHWDEAKQMFRLHTPTDGACKNWISQGCTATMACVVATLFVNGKPQGANGFLMRMRTADGKLVPGITIGDMGGKTVGNDLDNAWIRFTDVMLPKTALLNRYGDIVDGEYVQTQKGIRNITMIGQRLYTGRVVIAESCLIFARSLLAETKAYADQKMCWGAANNVQLSSIPQLRSLFQDTEQRLSRLEGFIFTVQDQLAVHLVQATMPPNDLVEAIAAGKVMCVETAIDICHRLRQEVGSFALMAGSGFEQTDYLQCCKFAEGDSRILMQKASRDRMRVFRKQAKAAAGSLPDDEEHRLCAALATCKGPADWDAKFQQVYRLAELLMNNIVDNFTPTPGVARL